METYQKMFNTMKRDNTFVNSTNAGVTKVREGGFAYLTDEPYLDYYNKKSPCNTMMLKNLLEAKSYGIALQRNSDMTNQFSVAILQVIINGKSDTCSNYTLHVTVGSFKTTEDDSGVSALADLHTRSKIFFTEHMCRK